ncbi:Large protein with 8 or more transmembrane domains within NH2 region, related [Neospora caninum Liverpool]|uniref:Large protein with 8 or more transmembrane domains within NH2 region, related n=1 Tax=Neospora caninum (strain Liverpool) TaxID=572307 RepID=F0VDJ7_NEOCL|nr:Large protein with 8 or more transmembrane domains within NH2 region, related [Neospora caninum Liverpool]CBZ51790.1 Large protein with 8 or more transmembrane domains within NH2 region, related [Neospora caninum Liverpool]|eukprot:XP_003881823.1 Large protein with 8 or more transmembrane domains within NH2 region, related [Neospora caninum Liverpool]
MGLQVETPSFLLRQIFRLVLDCTVVAGFIGCMVYIATFGNTWTTVSMRFVPSLLGWAFFLSSVFVFEPLYQLYVGITTGQWPTWAARSTLEPRVHGQFKLEEEQAEKAREEGVEQPDARKILLLTKKKALRFNRLVTDFKMRRKLKFRQGLIKASMARLLYWHHLLRHSIHRVCSRPSFALATVVWNFAWSVSWCLTLQRWRRDGFDELWDFRLIQGSDYATQEFFLSAATLEFLMIFLQQTEVMQMLLWPSFWVELFTLPPLTVLFYFVFERMFSSHYIAAELLLLTGWLRWIKTFVMTRFISASVVWGNATKGHVVQLVLGIVFLLTAFASAMFTSDGINPESVGDLDRNLYTVKEFFNFWYFGVVTMSTVGYGDISPRTVMGQCFCITFIVTALIWLPSEFGRLIESLTSRRKVWGRLPLRIDHTAFVVLLGDVEPAQLSTFLQEVRLRRAVPPKVVVLSRHPFEDYRNQMEEAQSGQVRLCLVTGEAGIGGDPSDLLLVQPNHSQGVFVLSSPSALSAYYDRQTLTRLLSLMRLQIDPAHIAVQLCTNVCANIIASMGCLNYSILSDLKMGLIAKALCGHSGIIPLICNLSGSTYPDVPIGQLARQFPPETLPGLCEYVKGAMHSLYAFRVPPCMFGVPFEEVCLGLYYCANIICVGIERDAQPKPSTAHDPARGCGKVACCSSLGRRYRRLVEGRPAGKQAAGRRHAASTSFFSPVNSSMQLCSSSDSSDSEASSPRSREDARWTVARGSHPDAAGEPDGARHVSFFPSLEARPASPSRAAPNLRPRKRAGGNGAESGSSEWRQRQVAASSSPEHTAKRTSGQASQTSLRGKTGEGGPGAASQLCPSLSCRSSVVSPQEERRGKQPPKGGGKPKASRLPYFQTPNQKISFWVNPAGTHYHLREGDKCVIIAPSVGAAEFLESATVVPWSSVFSSPLGRFVDLLATQPARAAAQAAEQAVALAADAKEVVHVAITATKDAVGNVVKAGSDEESSAASSVHNASAKTSSGEAGGNRRSPVLSPKKRREHPEPRGDLVEGAKPKAAGATAEGAAAKAGVGGNSAAGQEGKRGKGVLEHMTGTITPKEQPETTRPGEGAGRIEGRTDDGELSNGEATAAGADGRRGGQSLDMDDGESATEETLPNLRDPGRAVSGQSEEDHRRSRNGEREHPETACEDRLEPRGRPKQFSFSSHPATAPLRSSSTEWCEEPAPVGSSAAFSGSSPGFRRGESRTSLSTSAARASGDADLGALWHSSRGQENHVLTADQPPSTTFASFPTETETDDAFFSEVPYSSPTPSRGTPRETTSEPHPLPASSHPFLATSPQHHSPSASRAALPPVGSPSSPDHANPTRHCLAPPPAALTSSAQGTSPESSPSALGGALAPRLLPLHLTQPAFPADGDTEPANLEKRASSLGTFSSSQDPSGSPLYEDSGYATLTPRRGRSVHERPLVADRAGAERDRDTQSLQSPKSWASLPVAIPTPLELREGRTAEISPSAAAGASNVFKRLFSTPTALEVDRLPVHVWAGGGDEEATVPVVHVGAQDDFDKDLDSQSVGCIATERAEEPVYLPGETEGPEGSKRSSDAEKRDKCRESGRKDPAGGVTWRDARDVPGDKAASDPRRGRATESRYSSDYDDSSTDGSDLLAEPQLSCSDQIFASSYQEGRRLIFSHPDLPLMLICGWPKYLGGLLMKIKAIGGWNVVILTAEAPPPWGDLRYVFPFRRFTAIVRARPLSEVNLVRAGVLDAKRFFIFPLGLDNTVAASGESIVQQDDRNVILVYLQIKNLLLQKADMLLRLRATMPQRQQSTGWREPRDQSTGKASALARALSRSSSHTLRSHFRAFPSARSSASPCPTGSGGRSFPQPLHQNQAVHQQSFSFFGEEGGDEERGEAAAHEEVRFPPQARASRSQDGLGQDARQGLHGPHVVRPSDTSGRSVHNGTGAGANSGTPLFHASPQHAASSPGLTTKEDGLRPASLYLHGETRQSSLPLCGEGNAKGARAAGREGNSGRRGSESLSSWIPSDRESVANPQLGPGLNRCGVLHCRMHSSEGRGGVAPRGLFEDHGPRIRLPRSCPEARRGKEQDAEVRRGHDGVRHQIERVKANAVWRETAENLDSVSSDLPFASFSSEELMKIASEASLQTDPSPSCLDTEFSPHEFFHGNLELGHEFLSENVGGQEAAAPVSEREARDGASAGASSSPKPPGVASPPSASPAVSSTCSGKISTRVHLSMAKDTETPNHPPGPGIERNVKDYPCYSSATYLLSPEYISGNLFADRMNFGFLTQHPAISPYSITPQFLSELIGYAFTGKWPGIQLESIPPSSLEDGLTFGDLFRTLLLDNKKIAVGLYRSGIGALKSYVYTCPSRQCLLQPTDRVFVIPVGFPRPPLSPEKVIKRVNAYLATTLAGGS